MPEYSGGFWALLVILPVIVLVRGALGPSRMQEHSTALDWLLCCGSCPAHCLQVGAPDVCPIRGACLRACACCLHCLPAVMPVLPALPAAGANGGRACTSQGSGCAAHNDAHTAHGVSVQPRCRLRAGQRFPGAVMSQMHLLLRYQMAVIGGLPMTDGLPIICSLIVSFGWMTQVLTLRLYWSEVRAG